MSFSTFLPGRSQAKGSTSSFVTKSGRVVTTSANRKLAGWTEAAVAHLKAAHEERPPLTGPLAVTFVDYRVEPKRKLHRHPVTPPDSDKVERALWDALVKAGVIEDDRFIVYHHGCKVYAGDHPVGLQVNVWGLG